MKVYLVTYSNYDYSDVVAVFVDDYDGAVNFCRDHAKTYNMIESKYPPLDWCGGRRIYLEIQEWDLTKGNTKRECVD